MAGVGFELKKLFREQGLIQNLKAYAFSSITTIGPMLLCMTMIIGMQRMMLHAGSPFAERELLLATVVYCFIFSVLLTGGLSMVLTRFIADMMFLKQYEHLLSSFYGSIAVCLPVGTLTSWLFLRGIPASAGYKAAAYVFFAELVVIWIASVHLSALKDYKRIVKSFFIGVLISVTGAWLLLKYTPYQGAAAVLSMMDIGFFILVLLIMRNFERTFPPKASRYYFSFLAYFRKYPSLFLIGTGFYAGVYVHSFVYWFGPYKTIVAERFAISTFFDLPVFYAYLTVVPTLVTFVVSVETSFYEKFRDYYSKVLKDGTILDITRSKKEMQRTLMQEISFLMEVQLLFTILSIALGIKLLPALGFTYEQLAAFNMLTLGYFLFIIAFVAMLLMLYFDDRKGALAISSLFVILNTGFSYWTMLTEYHGLGLFLAAFITLLSAFARLMSYVRGIDYYTFCSQPIVAVSKPPLRKRMRLPWRKAAVTGTGLLLSALLLTACSGMEAGKDPVAVQENPKTANSVASARPEAVSEDKRLYERDNDTSVIPLYMTVLPDKSDKGLPLTWYGMNRIQSMSEEGDLKVILQEGAADGSGPKAGAFGFGAADSNGKVSLRGNTSRYASQRSYKVKLTDQAGLWRDQRVINLNKHAFDPSRFMNKLSFDLFETLPDIASLRTQFVHLYVKDLSEGGSAEKPFEDYGLYTHIEQPNELFLKNHWLDPYGQLYKAVMFEFFRYPDEIKAQTDPAYNKAAFEGRLEIRGREEHEKLMAMLDDVNNPSIPIDEIMDKYFDLDNYLTWMAANILMDNMDTDAQNYLLYSPLNSSKWYFLPWDYDGGFERQRSLKRISDYSKGISNYWGNVLHNRFFRSEKNVKLLKDKIDELYGTINNDVISQKIQTYRPVVEPFLKAAPDKNFLPVNSAGLEEEFNRIANTPLRAIERFNQDLQGPRPIYLGDMESKNGKNLFTWDPSFDLQGDDLMYDWTLAKDPGFTQIVQERTGLTGTSIEADALPPGDYFWKVTVKDSNGHRQIAFDIYFDEENTPYYGIRKIKVEQP